MADMIFRRRRLPHQDVDGHPFFITACLAGSLSAAGLSSINTYREELESRPCPKQITQSEWEHQKQKLVFGFVDKLLHWARDDAEVLRIIDYIENNPVKAGLVTEPEDYRWSSARIRREMAIKPGDAIYKVG